MPLPALRNVDAFPVEHEGQTFVCLRDSEGYAAEQLVLSPPAFAIASMLNGDNDVADVQRHFASKYNGRVATTEDIQSVVSFLDEQGFLLSERFLVLRHTAHRTFSDMPYRPAACAGRSYPESPDELRALFDGLLEQEPSPKPADSAVAPRLLIVPHIDFARGGQAYGAGYGALRHCAPPKLIVVFGVAHSGGDAPFILTKKDFATPLGTLRTDVDAVERLAKLCPRQDDTVRRADEYVHRNEHSIEFQLVWLAYLFGATPRIVPILCGDTLSGKGRDTRAFLAACRELAGGPAGEVLIVAGADLAHVGRCFGDDLDITPDVIARIEARDRADLESVFNVDAAGFVQAVLRDGNARHVCGLGCIHAALTCVTGTAEPGRLLSYGHAPDSAGGVVSFASIVFD